MRNAQCRISGFRVFPGGTMHLSNVGLDLLKKSEGFRDHIYADVAGFRTIGFGHRLATGENYPQGIDLSQAEKMLACDVAIAELAVERLIRVPLTQGQFDALVDFAFNLGAGRLASSTLLSYLNAGKYDAAAWQLLAWDHTGSHENRGLKARREAEFRLWSPAQSCGSAA
jgi:lysozyme